MKSNNIKLGLTLNRNGYTIIYVYTFTCICIHI